MRALPPSRPSLLSQALEEARAAAEAEQGRSMRLEVDLAEARQDLGRMEELEKELQHYRCDLAVVLLVVYCPGECMQAGLRP